jgi:energy-coupling factor transport system substrate-specific component
LRHRLLTAGALAALLVALVLVQARELAPGTSVWVFVLVGAASGIVLAFALRFESSGMHARVLAIVALLGTLSALFRVPFAAIPNLQPCTYLVLCSGYVFGPVAGFAVGALTAIVSNFFLGHGPWTLFQVLAWGLAGASAVLLRRFPLRPRVLVLAGIVWGVLFGVIMNLWTWIAFVYPLTVRTFLVTWLASIPFDVMHAAGNGIFLGFLGVKTIRILQRYHGRFTWLRLDEDDERLDVSSHPGSEIVAEARPSPARDDAAV